MGLPPQAGLKRTIGDCRTEGQGPGRIIRRSSILTISMMTGSPTFLPCFRRWPRTVSPDRFPSDSVAKIVANRGQSINAINVRERNGCAVSVFVILDVENYRTDDF